MTFRDSAATQYIILAHLFTAAGVRFVTPETGVLESGGVVQVTIELVLLGDILGVPVDVIVQDGSTSGLGKMFLEFSVV